MNIEDLIRKRKEDLNLDTPPEHVWTEIQNEWKPKKEKSFTWWKVAAILFISTSIGLLTHNLMLQNQVEELASLGDISDDYRAMESDYISQINQLESGLQLGEIEKNQDYKWLLDELKTLDEVNELYRKDIGKANKDQLVGVLIDYYEKKIRLLRKLELEIKRTHKLENDEETDIDSIRM